MGVKSGKSLELDRRQLIRGLLGLSVAATVLQSATALANSVVTGTVLDAGTRKPLADVIITLTSPAMKGEQTVVTDATGEYRVPQLPAGLYTLRAEKEKFKTFERSGLSVRVNSTLRVNLELLSEK